MKQVKRDYIFVLHVCIYVLSNEMYILQPIKKLDKILTIKNEKILFPGQKLQYH